MKKKKPSERILAAIDVYALARAEATWTNGYRARFEADPGYNTTEASRLYEKQEAQWVQAHISLDRLQRTIMRVLRELQS